MKNTFFIIICFIFLTQNLHARSNPFGVYSKPAFNLTPNIEITAGNVFNTESDTYKLNFSVNNIIANGFGVYASYEWEVNEENGYSSNIIGVTGSVLPWMYVFGGFDFFTDSGMFSNDPVNPIKSRKEIGLGIVPFKWVAIRAGFSNSMQWTLSAGLRIPVNRY